MSKNIPSSPKASSCLNWAPSTPWWRVFFLQSYVLQEKCPHQRIIYPLGNALMRAIFDWWRPPIAVASISQKNAKKGTMIMTLDKYFPIASLTTTPIRRCRLGNRITLTTPFVILFCWSADGRQLQRHGKRHQDNQHWGRRDVAVLADVSKDGSQTRGGGGRWKRRRQEGQQRKATINRGWQVWDNGDHGVDKARKHSQHVSSGKDCCKSN